MTVAKRFLVAVSVVLFGDQVLAIPQTITSPPPSTATLYDIIPSQQVSLFQNSSNFETLDGTYEATATILGVSSGLDGESETTYSFGRYLSINEVWTATSTDSEGQVATQTVTSFLFADTLNWTLVASSGGFWETESPYITTNPADGGPDYVEGGYLSCSYESGHTSALCTGLDLGPGFATVTAGSQVATVTEVQTFSVGYEGLISAFTVVTQAAPVETGSPKSNGELGRNLKGMCWSSAGVLSIFIAFGLSL
ncbi:hypothetical protein D9757_012224 [Collybiopsis confluens]|uniref:Uncharacterized protein n=1 Tax=Collybiopsis confluens TaxID=2823264 RepID=A0A8H5LRE5_9AGAR|nr:hypothetical protein D9757_012224 [Collybiopsis confluens]